MAAKVTRKFQEGNILFAHIVKNSDGAYLFVGKPNDLAARTAKLALERFRSFDGRVEMLLK